jgi:hypothetical protein
MPITIQPAFDALPAYRPIVFEAFLPTTLVPDVPVENAVVTIYNGATAITTIRYKSNRNQPGIPGSQDYFFDIDIQKICQDILAPSADLPSTMFGLGVFVTENTDFFGLFRIEITYEAISSTTGLLFAVPVVNDISNSFYIYTASRQCTAPLFEQMDLNDYVGAVVLSPETKFITKSSRSLKQKNADFSFLSVIQPNIGMALNGMQVELFDASGGLLYTGTTSTFMPPFSTQYTMNTGFDYLATVAWTYGAPNFSDPLIVSYTMSVGYLFPGVFPAFAYIRQSEVFSYELTGLCCGRRDLRLHWMNLLGGTDSYTFSSEKDLQLTTSSDRAQRSLSWEIGSLTPHSISDVGNFKIKSEGSTAYQLVSKFLTNTEATWLMELLTSPKVYAEINGDFVPVIIEDTSQSIDRQNGKIQYSITATLANDLIIQRI